MTQARSYTIVDTGQTSFYNNTAVIAAPGQGQAFYGQDATYTGLQASYTVNSNGTVTDQNTGLMWSQPDTTDMTWAAALSSADSSTYAGYDDWRLPTIKELYSLINFSGYTGTSSDTSKPYIDTSAFNFQYGDTSTERFIDAQYWSSTEYTGTTINGDISTFGVNFADGRIKSYPNSGNTLKSATVILVRGNTSYGVNDFHDNGDGTITDDATGLMWSASDSGYGMDWQNALSYADSSTLAGYSDWFLPNAKQLQSIVDYSQSPHATNSANIGPAINDTYFHLTNVSTTSTPDYSYYWSSTTHVEGGTGDYAVYDALGTAWGYMNGSWQDVHGAGAQRSDPKTQDGSYPTYWGPQGDFLSIYNYVLTARAVDDDTTVTGGDSADSLSGLTGNDKLTGGGGNDRMSGNSGHDTLIGSDGADTIDGGAGADILLGNAGRDMISGGDGSDNMFGGTDDDTLIGGNYNDSIRGDSGNDIILGNSGTDLLSGNDGADWLYGGANDDILLGNAGADTLAGDSGNDWLFGGANGDMFMFNSSGFGADTVGDFSVSEDKLVLSLGTTWGVISDALGDAVITVSDGSSITLRGISSTAVSSNLMTYQ